MSGKQRRGNVEMEEVYRRELTQRRKGNGKGYKRNNEREREKGSKLKRKMGGSKQISHDFQYSTWVIGGKV